jgi:hypothetical protein
MEISYETSESSCFTEPEQDPFSRLLNRYRPLNEKWMYKCTIEQSNEKGSMYEHKMYVHVSQSREVRVFFKARH